MFHPWSRKIPHAKGQLSLSATIAEPTHPGAQLHSKRSLQLEKAQAQQ